MLVSLTTFTDINADNICKSVENKYVSVFFFIHKLYVIAVMLRNKLKCSTFDQVQFVCVLFALFTITKLYSIGCN